MEIRCSLLYILVIGYYWLYKCPSYNVNSQSYSSLSSPFAPLLFASSKLSKFVSSSVASNSRLTLSLLRMWEFCIIGLDVSQSSWSSFGVSPGSSSSFPKEKHYISGLSSTLEATLILLGSFRRTTFQLGLSTSSKKNIFWTWRGNANELVEYGMTLSTFSRAKSYSSYFIVVLALVVVASTHVQYNKINSKIM